MFINFKLKFFLIFVFLKYQQISSIDRIYIQYILFVQKMSFGPRSIYTHSQVSTSPYDPSQSQVQNGGLFSREECRSLAKNIIQAYDGNNDGICETIEVAKWLVDCYRAMNKSFQPTATDIASYIQVVDRQKTGKITIDDLEAFITKYFHAANRQ